MPRTEPFWPPRSPPPCRSRLPGPSHPTSVRGEIDNQRILPRLERPLQRCVAGRLDRQAGFWARSPSGAVDGRFLRTAFAALDLFVDLGAMDADLAWCLDAESHLIAVARDHNDANVVSNDDRLVGLPG